jgi:hypothetical protein
MAEARPVRQGGDMAPRAGQISSGRWHLGQAGASNGERTPGLRGIFLEYGVVIRAFVSHENPMGMYE